MAMNPQAQDARGTGDGRQAAFAIPPVDVYEDEGGITLLADLPGVTRENLSVRVEGDSLLIEGSVSTPAPQELELLHGEAQLGSYRRLFTLSRELDANSVEAQLKDGVLQLRIPKAEAAKPRRIEVRLN
jgi:HSP20 family protein